MTRKIVFFDIDGTLTDEETFLIPDSTITAIRQAQSNGHLMFINTGRTYSAINRSLQDLHMDGMILGGGTHIRYHDEDIYYHALPEDMCNDIIQRTQSADAEGFFESRTQVAVPEKRRAYYLERIYQRYHNTEIPIVFYDTTPPFVFEKFCLWYYDEAFITSFKQDYAETIDFIEREPGFVECFPKHHNKATGIQFVLDTLHLDKAETIAIGDSTNDLTMLQYVHTAIAMGHSHPDILPYVSYVTSDLHDDGILHALKHFHLI